MADMWGVQRGGWRKVAGWLVGAGIITGACVTIEEEPAVPGVAGESCRSRIDCAGGLACIDGICTKPGIEPDAGSLDAAIDQTPDTQDASPDVPADAQSEDGEAGDTTDAEADGDAPSSGAIGTWCHDTSDCNDGLTCARNKCSGSENGFKPTGRACVVIECTQPSDCCKIPSPNCPEYKLRCQAGSPTYCAQYQAQCVCDPGVWQCREEQCISTPKCTSTEGCVLGDVCSNGVCVECATNNDCAPGYRCNANQCEFPCSINEHCGDFEECQSGECVHVGCSVHAECRAHFNGAVDAACVDGTCRRPCYRDYDCRQGAFGNSDGYTCFAGYCYPIGCETDLECRILLANQLTHNTRTECR